MTDMIRSDGNVIKTDGVGRVRMPADQRKKWLEFTNCKLKLNGAGDATPIHGRVLPHEIIPDHRVASFQT